MNRPVAAMILNMSTSHTDEEDEHGFVEELPDESKWLFHSQLQKKTARFEHSWSPSFGSLGTRKSCLLLFVAGTVLWFLV